MADDDDFDAIDAVHAHDCGVRRHHQLTVVGVRDFVETAANTPAHSRVAGTQHDEYALAAMQSPGGGGERAVAAPGNDEVDGSDHCVNRTEARPATRTGPVNVRRNASS